METIKVIKRLLNELNSNKFAGNMITRKLSENVVLAKIWLTPVNAEITGTPLHTYLITSEGKYIGMVMITESGPFAFMLPAQRKNGHMSGALKKVILPHLLQHTALLRLNLLAAELGGDRALTVAKKLAVTVGFDLLKEEPSGLKLAMDASRLKERTYIVGENEALNKDRRLALKRQIQYAASVLDVVQTELEYKRGISAYSEELGDYIKSLLLQADKLEHAWMK